jgi:hypothetical protein
MDSTKNALWLASLSNGQTFAEGKGDYVEIKGELSPWQRLRRYIVDKRVEITSLSLYTRDGRSFNLPSSGRNPKFRPFDVAQKPIDFILSRYFGRDLDVVDNKIVGLSPSDHFTVIEAIYPDYKLQLWVDENNTRNCWTLVVKQ